MIGEGEIGVLQMERGIGPGSDDGDCEGLGLTGVERRGERGIGLHAECVFRLEQLGEGEVKGDVSGVDGGFAGVGEHDLIVKILTGFDAGGGIDADFEGLVPEGNGEAADVLGVGRGLGVKIGLVVLCVDEVALIVGREALDALALFGAEGGGVFGEELLCGAPGELIEDGFLALGKEQAPFPLHERGGHLSVGSETKIFSFSDDEIVTVRRDEHGLIPAKNEFGFFLKFELIPKAETVEVEDVCGGVIEFDEVVIVVASGAHHHFGDDEMIEGKLGGAGGEGDGSGGCGGKWLDGAGGGEEQEGEEQEQNRSFGSEIHAVSFFNSLINSNLG